MSRKSPDTPARVRLGDTVSRHPITILGDENAGNDKGRSIQGRVVYIHPRGKFHVVEFPGGARESFSGVER